MAEGKKGGERKGVKWRKKYINKNNLKRKVHMVVPISCLFSSHSFPSDSREMQLSESILKFSTIWPLILPNVSTGSELRVPVTTHRSICPVISDSLTPMFFSREGSIQLG